MHELRTKVAEIRLKSDFRPKCSYLGRWEMNWYRHPFRPASERILAINVTALIDLTQ